MACFCELAMPLASRLCERLGLATNSPESVDAARDKHATRALMEQAGLPTPRNLLIKTADDLPKVRGGCLGCAVRLVWLWRFVCV